MMLKRLGVGVIQRHLLEFVTPRFIEIEACVAFLFAAKQTHEWSS